MTKPSTGKINLVIESCYHNIDLLGTCIDSLSAELFDSQQCYQIKVAVYEVVTNCIKHGYGGSPEHQVHVSYQIGTDKIILDIADSGIALDTQLLQDTPTHFEVDHEDPQEGGMGLKIIKLFMDEISYHSKDGMNHFLLVKYIA